MGKFVRHESEFGCVVVSLGRHVPKDARQEMPDGQKCRVAWSFVAVVGDPGVCSSAVRIVVSLEKT